MRAARKGTRRQSTTKIPIWTGELATDGLEERGSSGALVEACRFSKYAAYSVFSS